eukprot:CAMPEP_0118647552 /NCGR_PEP_ID=MMETSP0785-20121206/8669_1 /TAXON_ID=91992 /ORGANISM="Bolidomonas pacifica, Strain CCMP 1866" /LENGTH=577 /DNA_ID=CAMNT_0006539657 /DNA_START=228 /DNA_END=1961 /DNA_ORIENTATION=+
MAKTASYNEMFCLKILLSSSSSGNLIGKSGATIRSLEHQFKCRIKLSQSGCFFPKTALRVCLITGAPSSVNSVVAFILDQAEVISASVVQRLVVPASSIGFVIADVSIRSPIQCPIHEELLHVNVEVKIEDLADHNKERIVMLEGSKNGSKIAFGKIIDQMVEQWEVSKYENSTTYYGHHFPGASVQMGSSPPLHHHIPIRQTLPNPSHHHSPANPHTSPILSSSPHSHHPPMSPLPRSTAPGPHPNQPGGSPQSYMYGYGYSPPGGLYTQQGWGHGSHPQHYQQGAPIGYGASPAQYGIIGDISRGDSSGGVPQHETCIHVAVPDCDVGAIFGRGGQTITELQTITGTRIKVSQRYEYVRGTEDRIVSIIGTLDACQTCSWLIQQRVGQSQGDRHKRSRRAVAAAVSKMPMGSVVDDRSMRVHMPMGHSGGPLQLQPQMVAAQGFIQSHDIQYQQGDWRGSYEEVGADHHRAAADPTISSNLKPEPPPTDENVVKDEGGDGKVSGVGGVGGDGGDGGDSGDGGDGDGDGGDGDDVGGGSGDDYGGDGGGGADDESIAGEDINSKTTMERKVLLERI